MNRHSYLLSTLLLTAVFGLNAQTLENPSALSQGIPSSQVLPTNQAPTILANPSGAPQPIQQLNQQPSTLTLTPREAAKPISALPVPAPAIQQPIKINTAEPTTILPATVNQPQSNRLNNQSGSPMIQLKRGPTLEEMRAQMQRGKWPDPSVCINPTPAAKRNVCLPPKLSLNAKSPVKSGTSFTPAVEFSYVQSAELITVDLKTNQRSVIWRFSNGDPGRYYYANDLKIPSVTILNNTRLQLIAKNPYYPTPSIANKGVVFTTIQALPAAGSNSSNAMLLPGQKPNTPNAGFASGFVNAPNSGGFATMNNHPSCVPTTDIWQCRGPKIIGLSLSKQGQDILDGKKGNPIGQQIHFTLTYSNAEQVEVTAPYKHFSPLTIISETNLKPKQNVSVNVPLTIRQQSFSIAIAVSNPHGAKQITQNYRIKHDSPPQLTAKWMDGTGPSTTVDPGELIDLVLEQAVNTDSIALKLTTSPASCAGSVFRDNNSDSITVLNPLGMTNRRTNIRVPVIPAACSGKPYTLNAEITPMQNRVVIQSAKQVSQKLQVTGPKLANPKIISFNMTTKHPRSNGAILAGDDVTIDMEFVNADALIVKSHDGSTILTQSGGFGRKYIKGPLFFKADDAFDKGFDIIIQSRGAGQTLTDVRRVLPKVRRIIKLETNVKWDLGNSIVSQPKNLKIACSVTNNKNNAVSASKQLHFNGRNKGSQRLTFDMEMLLRGDSQDSSAVFYNCSATSKGPETALANVLIGHGTINKAIPYTFATWPVSEVKISTETLQLGNF